MKAVFSLGLAILLVAGTMHLQNYVNQEETVSHRDLIRSTSAYGVIQDKYSNYKEIGAVKEKVAEPKEEITINKFKEKHNDDYLGSIDIPVIKTSDAIYKSKGDYYLEHNFKKQSFEPGEVYVDERTGSNLLTNGLLLNGHAVPDGTKFGNFKKLLDIEDQPDVFIYDEQTDTTSTYKMLFVSLIDGQNSGIIMKFPNEALRVKYYKNLYSTAIKQWEEPSDTDTFLLLNSCAYIIQDGHYVVVAKKVEGV